jgi:hypothetical protein
VDIKVFRSGRTAAVEVFNIFPGAGKGGGCGKTAQIPLFSNTYPVGRIVENGEYARRVTYLTLGLVLLNDIQKKKR